MDAENVKGHSEEFFTEYRDHWWNQDFLELMARRWGLQQYTSLLDVGCGQFHWSRLLAPFMDAPSVVGLDNDAKWSTTDIGTYKKFFSNAARLELIAGNAEDLPFPDNSFDVVTCQTLLIHLKNPAKALSEMRRVVKPGGIVICAEPNNLAPALSIDCADDIHDIEDALANVKESLYYQYGKFLSGHGYNSIGDITALLLQQTGFAQIQTYFSDKCVSLIPPYSSQQELDTIKTWRTFLQTEPLTDEYLNYLKQAETKLGEIQLDVAERAETGRLKTLAKIDNGSWYNPGLAIMYLVSGRKLPA